MDENVYKKELADMLADEFDLSRKLAIRQTDFIFDCITEYLKEGKIVTITNFGKFQIREKVSKNQKKTNYVNFKMAKNLKDSINE